jgi:hypothetical protein
LKSQYIFALLLFLAKHRDLYESNLEIQIINARSNSDLHTPMANFITFKKGPFYFGIKVFNHPPTGIKNTSHDINKFRSVFKNFVLTNSFYLLEEYFTWNSNKDFAKCNHFKCEHRNNRTCNVTQYHSILLL